MKQIFLSLLTFLFFVSAFSQQTALTQSAQKSFEADYPNAQNIKWSVLSDILQVSFTLHNEKISVYYSDNGGFVAEGKVIMPDQLPKDLQNNLQNLSMSSLLQELLQIKTKEGVTYYAILICKGKKLIYRAYAGKWFLC